MFFVFILIIDIRINLIPLSASQQAPKHNQKLIDERPIQVLTQPKISQIAEIPQL